MYIDYLASDLGIINIEADDKGLLKVSFNYRIPTNINSNYITKSAKKALLDYFATKKPLPIFEISAKLSVFQNKVYKSLREAATLGTIMSYKELPNTINTSPRAIGRALATNPIALFIPCHRVVAKNGTLGGFLYGLPIKKALLLHEKI